MKRIVKLEEPPELAQYRASATVDFTPYFDGYPHKDDLRTRLVQEQKGICCYCMSRIRPVGDEMKIEHWQCVSRYENRQLSYSNLLGACKGGHGKQKDLYHCDTLKADLDLQFNPADSALNIEERIRYQTNGTIKSDHQVFDSQLNDVLGLNLTFLKNNRKSALDGFTRKLKPGQLTMARIDREIEKWSGIGVNAPLEPFCGVIIYWLRRKRNRGNAQ